MSQTTTQTDIKEHAIRNLRALIYNGDIVHTLIERGRSETDYVRVLIVLDGVRIEDISGRVARATGCRLVNTNKHYGIAKRGCQYNKGQEVYAELKQTIDLDIDWKEI